ncbi:MAG: GNAT family N-acetyltransferase [Lachnospiraceae bacterium]|nr:GNAT family N-acetyltransferase [Lachnospiraceae bacterium]
MYIKGNSLNLQYEFGEYLAKVLPAYYCEQVLVFYQENQLHFDIWEAKRDNNFYTKHYQRNLLEVEFNAAVKGKMLRYYIFYKNNPNQIIGCVNFHEIKRGAFCSCQIGYKVHHKFCNRGIGKETVGKLIDYIFAESGLHRIEALIHPENAPSIALAEKVGFEREGIVKGAVMLCGQWQDMYRYGLVNNDEKI